MTTPTAMVTTAPATGRLFAAEFVGTTLVMLAGPGLIDPRRRRHSRLELALGFGVATAIAIGVIGAVANPMFSLALWFARAISGRELGIDVIGQLCGAVFGGAVLFALRHSFAGATNGYDPGDLDRRRLGFDLGFADLGVVLGRGVGDGGDRGDRAAVGDRRATVQRRRRRFRRRAVTLAALFLQPISGVGINPARSLGTAIFADTDPNALGQLWLFIVIPVSARSPGCSCGWRSTSRRWSRRCRHRVRRHGPRRRRRHGID